MRSVCDQSARASPSLRDCVSKWSGQELSLLAERPSLLFLCVRSAQISSSPAARMVFAPVVPVKRKRERPAAPSTSTSAAEASTSKAAAAAAAATPPPPTWSELLSSLQGSKGEAAAVQGGQPLRADHTLIPLLTVALIHSPQPALAHPDCPSRVRLRHRNVEKAGRRLPTNLDILPELLEQRPWPQGCRRCMGEGG